MANKKKLEKKIYLTLDYDATAIDWSKDKVLISDENLSQAEWKSLEGVFTKHPTLIRITAPYRDPELNT